MASGRKTIETRKWATKYHEELLIISSKSPNIPPAGYALAVAELVDCRPMVKADEKAAMCPVYPKAYSWVLKNIRKTFTERTKLGRGGKLSKGLFWGFEARCELSGKEESKISFILQC